MSGLVGWSGSGAHIQGVFTLQGEMCVRDVSKGHTDSMVPPSMVGSVDSKDSEAPAECVLSPVAGSADVSVSKGHTHFLVPPSMVGSVDL